MKSSAQEHRRVVVNTMGGGSAPPVIIIRRNVEPALRTLTAWRSMTAAKRLGGATGEPSSMIDGTRHSKHAASMYLRRRVH